MQGLTTVFDVEGRSLRAVDDVSFTVRRGETLGLVGESGSGKSVTALSVLGLVRPPGRIAGGRVVFEGQDLLGLPEKRLRAIRGARIALILQEPMTALNPVFPIGQQIAEAMEVHGVRRPEARARAVELLEAVRIPDAARRARDYPHQLSGGMRQRVLIAMALSCRPSLVIADEPTTALDATIQAEILDLLEDMRRRFELSLILVTHDLGLVSGLADRVAVMYAGQIVEQGPVREIASAPAHPYTRALVALTRDEGSGRRLNVIEGNVPPPDARPEGCRFAPRCGDRKPECVREPPATVTVGAEHEARCVLHAGRPA